jgi:hypothetical protein
MIKKLTQPSNDLAYILGVLSSDGYVSKNKKNNRYVITLQVIDKEFRDKYGKLFESHFGVNGYYGDWNSENENHSRVYYFTLSHREIHKDIGNFHGEHWHNTIMDKYRWVLDDDYFYDFLSGFFDGDGSIRNPDKTYCLRLHIGYKEPFFWLKEVLKDKGYDFNVEYRNDREEEVVKQLELNSVIQIQKLAQKIVSSIPRKEERLDRFRKGVIEYPSYYDNIDEVFWLLKKVREETGFGARRLAKHEKLREYNIPYTTIRNWLLRDTVPQLMLASKSNRIRVEI